MHDCLDKSTSHSHRETEKFRSKFNRAQFKVIMDELTLCFGFKKMTTNKCLSTAVSLIKLDKFTESFQTNDTSHLSDNRNILTEIFYDVGNFLGVSFDEKGRILHISKRQTEHSVPFNLCNIGSALSQICFNSQDILNQVFVKDRAHFLMELKYSKKDKRPTIMFFTGKISIDSSTGMKIFLGYGFIEDKRDTVRNPLMFHTGCEVLMNQNYEIVKSHSWLDYLMSEQLKQLKEMGPLNIFSVLHPDDLSLLETCTEEARMKGQFKTCCRIFDGENYLCLYVQGFPPRRNRPLIQMSVWPFAYECFKTGEHSMINLKKLWMQQPQGKRVRRMSQNTPVSSPAAEPQVCLKRLDLNELVIPSQQNMFTITDIECGDPNICVPSTKTSAFTPVSPGQSTNSIITPKRPIPVQLVQSLSKTHNPKDTSFDPTYMTTIPGPKYMTTIPDHKHLTSISDPTYITTSPDPKYMTTITDSIYATTILDHKHLTSSPDPKYITTSPDPKYITTSPDPKYMTAITDPEYMTAITDPEYMTTITDPEYMTTITDHKHLATSPETIAPQPLQPKTESSTKLHQLVLLHDVFLELNSANPQLYNKLTNILANNTDSASLMCLVPYLLKAPSRCQTA